MVVSLPFRRFVQQLAGLTWRTRVVRLRTRRRQWQIVAAAVENLEPRQLLSSIIVSSTSGGQNYASTVTVSQLDPAHTAVTLRDAIDAANNTTGADTISFDSTVFPPNGTTPVTISLTGGTPLTLSDTSGATTIVGPGASELTVSGNNQSTVFVVNFGVTATLQGLTITGGKASVASGLNSIEAGGIYNNGRLTLQNMVLTGNNGGNFGGGLYNNNTVTVTGSTFSNNTAQFGGGLFNAGTATVTRSTFSGNSVTSNGGGFYNQAFFTLEASTVNNNTAATSGGGFYSNNTATIVDSTIALNSAGTSGGGLYNLSTVNLIDSTIASNYSALGAGVYNNFATANVSGTIIAQNSVSPTNSASRDWGGTSAGLLSSFNLIGDGTNGGFVNGIGNNIVGTTAAPVNPLLGALGDYGGPTATMALLPGSLAINAGSTFNDPLTGTAIAADQRGVSRSQGSAPDIGAFESAGFAWVVSQGSGQQAVVGQNFAKPLAVQLTEKAFGKPLHDAGLVVTFTAPPTPPNAKLSAGTATTNASGIASVTATANGTIGGPYSVVASSAGIDSATFQLTNVEAPSLVVNTTQDIVNNMDGLTGLREAILYADTFSTPTTITFAPSAFPAGSLTTITLSGAPLEINNGAAKVTIAGPGAGSLAVSGAGLSTVFLVDAGTNSAISGLTISGGKGTSGGGINNAGTLALQNDTLSGDSATNGGAIFNSGSLTVTASTLSLNSATSGGGAIFSSGSLTLNSSTLSGNSAGSGGGLYNSGAATISQSTIAGNSATNGGGIDSHAGSLTATASTIARNFAATGGGLFNESGDVTLAGTILALNVVSATNSAPSDWAGSAADAASSFSLVGDGTNTGLVNGIKGNITGNATSPVNPQLGPLANNGGPTQTMALLAGSPAINAGSNSLLTGLISDQRGAGFVRIAGGTADIGAYEIQSHPPATPTDNAISTTNTTPTLTGTWDSSNATILAVTISNGASYSATYTLGTSPQLTVGTGTWSLNLAGTSPLAVGSYNVVVHTVNDIGEVSDSMPGSLTIQSVPPVLAAFGPQTARVGTSVNVSAAVLSGDLTGLTATINWGDGTTTAGTIATVNGVLTVSGSHAYAAEGQYTIQLTATNASSLSGSSSAQATILPQVPAAPTVNPLTTTSTTPTLTGTFDSLYAVVLQVTISSGASYSAAYTLGTNPQLTVNGANWSLNLTGTTPLAIGSYTVSVHTANDIGESSDSAPGSLTVKSTPPAIASLSPQSARIGVPVNVLAAITGGDLTGLVATIDWGDGTTSAGKFTTVGGVLTVCGTHAYSAEGQFTIEVTATNASNLSGSASMLATILSPVPSAPTVASLSTTNQTPVLTGTFDPVYAAVLQVTISNSSSYSATYTLGTSPQLTVTGASWSLNLGSTTPLAVGSYSVVVHTANDIGESSDSAPGTLNILSTPPVVASLSPLSARIGFPITVAAGITGGDTTGLTATINWGDGTTTAGTLATVNGVLTVSGSHAYSAEGQFTIEVTATNASNLSGSASTVATVLSPVPATPTVTSLSTTNTTPVLSGTFDALYATVLEVTISNSASYSASYTLGTNPQLTVSGGTWSLNLAGTTPLAVGSYTVSVHTANDIGEASNSAPGSLTIESTPPVIATLSPQSARIGVPINVSAAITGGDLTGLFATINWGDGTTTAGTLATVGGVLTVTGSHAYSAEGKFTIQVTATNASNLSTSTSAVATILSSVPATPTVSALSTTDRTPTLSGTFDSLYAVVLQVTVSKGAAYSATYTLGTDPQLTVNGGTWSLNLAGTTPLAVGSYMVSVHTANDNAESSDASGSLTIQSTPPVIASIGSQSARIGVPVNISAAITGGDTTGLTAMIDWGDGTTTAGTIATVNGVLTVSGSHAYSSEGQFNIEVTATSASSLSGTSSGTASILSLVPATPTVNALSTTDRTPTLSGTFDSLYAVVLQVTVSKGAAYSATYTLGTDPQLTVNGGTWSLNLAGTTPLAVGSYMVSVHTANDNAESSDASGSLTIQSTPPVIASIGQQTARIGAPVTISAAITGGDTAGLTTMIDWGDGTTTVGTLATVDGVLTVSGSHAYSIEGQFNIEVTATNASSLSGSSSGTATILNPVPATPSVTSISTTSTTPTISGTYDPLYAFVLQVTVSNSALSYSATYTLGSNPQLTVSGGTWSLNLAGTTPLAVGSFKISVHTANDVAESSDGTGSLTILSTPPVIASLGSQSARIGVPVNVSAAITGGDTTGLTAMIDWGDGTTTAGTIATVNGVLTVSGSHAYSTQGQFGIQLTATNASSLSGSASGSATILSLVSSTPTVGSLSTTNTTPTLSGTFDSVYAVVLQVTISNGGSYSATYTLGTNPQLTVSGGTWSLNLAGTTPLAVGSYSVVVHTANDNGESSDSAPGSLTINSTPPVVGSLNPQSATVGVPVNISAAITGGDTTGLTAMIDWGDGTTTPGTIATVNGVLTVSGSHAYSSAGQFNIQLTATNASNLSTSVSTTASIANVAGGGDLKVTGGKNVQISATDPSAYYDFNVKFSSDGVKLIGENGTTFNGQQTLVIANANSFTAKLGNGDNHVTVTGSGKNVMLSMGTGQNEVVLRNFSGQKAQVTSAGSLKMRALNTTLSNLSVKGGGSADVFRASGLVVSNDTQLNFGDGTNKVAIDGSQFKNFKLQSKGSGTIVRIEAGKSDGDSTEFDGNVELNLGAGAQLSFSPNSGSDETVFNGNLNISGGSPDATWKYDNVSFAKSPTLHNVDIV
jgi:sporulation-control protein spo0M